MKERPTRADRFGLVHPAVDAHTLGLSSVAQLLQDCGYQSVMADAAACAAFGSPEDPQSVEIVERWIREHRITYLGLSYRLDPAEGAHLFGRLVYQLKNRCLLQEQGGPLKGLFFAGLPETCQRVRRQHPEAAGVFLGSETPAQTLAILGIDPVRLPHDLAAGMAYDEARLAFGKDLIARAGHLGVKPIPRGGYETFGTRTDSLVSRLRHVGMRGQLPLFRAHVGPYLPDRLQAMHLFQDWARELASDGLLDVLSIGTSQLTQASFGEDWGGRPNGGGVPLNSPDEFAAVWQAARPLLVRTYAGTTRIPELARMYEARINMAWHALSLWWFCQSDGRGPYPVRENLRQHLQTLRYIATTGKPFEANVSHHFAFRGGDDVTYVVSAVLAARAAKSAGIRYFILQNMLNTPKYTWGVQDLAKSRAVLGLVRELQDDRFQVILQPRAGLDYFSPDGETAKAQLAAATALMDDIEPRNPASPPVIHVVSYSEATRLADPPTVKESIQITRYALDQYRRLRARGEVDDMTAYPEVARRTQALLAEAHAVIQAIDAAIPDPATADGLYEVLARGFLVVPYLWECREEFRAAVQWQTRLLRGSVTVVDERGRPWRVSERLACVARQ
ncbi:MAG: cobalamin-binding protein [Candidatus Anammoximicrobium sp.]|nr:cobalamin-binding protein [Candidatus Anammoximicrobium sp.]